MIRCADALIRVAASFLTLAATTAFAFAQDARPACHAPRQPRQEAELLFGRDIGRHLGVSESAWRRFLENEITPRFPDGLTVTDAQGQWRERDGALMHEPAKHVEIVLPGANDDEAKLDAIVAAYKTQFRQHGVVLIIRTACVSF